MSKKSVAGDQAKDTGLAMVLILLLAAYLRRSDGSLVLTAIVVLVTTMTCPAIFTPLAKVWFRFSHLLGGIVSKLLLTIVFLTLVTPIGFIRRVFVGADAMRSKAWKNGASTAFDERQHEFSQEDLTRPY